MIWLIVGGHSFANQSEYIISYPLRESLSRPWEDGCVGGKLALWGWSTALNIKQYACRSFIGSYVVITRCWELVYCQVINCYLSWLFVITSLLVNLVTICHHYLSILSSLLLFVNLVTNCYLSSLFVNLTILRDSSSLIIPCCFLLLMRSTTEPWATSHWSPHRLVIALGCPPCCAHCHPNKGKTIHCSHDFRLINSIGPQQKWFQDETNNHHNFERLSQQLS